MKRLIQKHWKTYAISIVTSFLAGFAVEMVADLDQITLETVLNGSYAGFVFAWIRTGVKVVAQSFLAWKLDQK